MHIMNGTMDRRTFGKLASLTAASAMTGTLNANNAEGSSRGELILEDASLLAGFDPASGALVRLEQKSPRWIVQHRPELGISFRLHAPLPTRRDNFVLGRKQKAKTIARLSEHHLSIEWKDLISEHGGILPISFSASVTLENGSLTFQGTLINNSPFSIETVDYPYIGDLVPPASDSTIHARIMRYDDLQSHEIYPTFSNVPGYWGVEFPTKTLDSCYSLFCLIQAPSQGLYVQLTDPTSRYLLQYTFELHPGVVAQNIVPMEDEIAGIPVHMEFRTCHFVFVNPRTTVILAPIVIRPYQGDWHAGVDLYKQWRATWYERPNLPTWTQDVHSWQQLQINSPEEEFRIPYKGLVEYAQECAKNGVTAIQLVGWNRGGQDRGNPCQDTDPGLGTWQELHDAIARIHSMGVKIILFAKFPWADITTEWYRKELDKYASTDPYGIPYQMPGDSYRTPTQLAGINNRRFAVMDFLSPEYRRIVLKEFRKLLDLNATGWLYDEVCVCATGKYNFAPTHGYPAPGYIYAGTMPLARELHHEASKMSPDFLFAGEGPQDWLTQYYPFSYFRDSPTPGQRYIDPYAPIMVAVTGFDDREEINSILLRRYIISYEPYNFKGKLSDFPLTLAYGRKVDALRRRYKPWIWDAEFRDTLGAAVTSDGSHTYSVFIGGANKRAVVVVNQEFQKAITATVELPNPGRLIVATPEQPDAENTSGTIKIPARSACVVMEA